MESDSSDVPSKPQSSSVSQDDISDTKPPISAASALDNKNDSLSASSLTSWAKNLNIGHSSAQDQEDPQTGNTAKSTFARFTSGLGLRFPPAVPPGDKDTGAATTAASSGVLESFTKGVVDSSLSAVKAVQVKARHMVSQNKRRYQEGEFDLDLSYITENIIAMGFPAGDMSSGLFGYVEGFYRNHMEEVIKFLETHHQGKYKVYNLCSERLYDASLFQGKAACFPFDDHNCPPLQLILLFCQSAYSWLKQDIENVVVVHCKAGMGRTGLMISSLLLYLKFCTTAEESIDYFNQKRCIDGKGLVLPSQIRYVKYFDRILKNYHGENQPGRRCMLRGFRLHGCPYWIRPSITISDHNGVLFSTKKHPKTKDLMPEDFWINSSKKGIVVFALPGERGLTELAGDFKIHFHDRHGDFYCWFNTTMMENRTLLSTDDLDGFDKRKLPSPKFHVEMVMVDYNGTVPENLKPHAAHSATSSDQYSTGGNESAECLSQKNAKSGNEEKDDVFSDSDGEGGSARKRDQTFTGDATSADEHTNDVHHRTEQGATKEPTQIKPTSSKLEGPVRSASSFETPHVDSSVPTDFKAIAADASVFSFGDDEDYDSE